MGWNVYSTAWNVYSSPWNVRSASRNIKHRQPLAENHCSFVEKVDYFRSYSQYGLTRIITIHAQG